MYFETDSYFIFNIFPQNSLHKLLLFISYLLVMGKKSFIINC